MTLFGRFLILAFLLIVGSHTLSWATTEPVAAPTEIQTHLRKLLATEAGKRQFICRGESICTAPLIPLFYQKRAFKPAWSQDGQLNAHATELVAAITNADAEGLRPADYHLFSINFLFSKLERLQGEGQLLATEELVDLDLLLTDAFLLYGSHLLNGRINPEAILNQWTRDDHTTDHAAILKEALSSQDITTTLLELRPPHEGYRRMRTALIDLRSIAQKGGWPVVGTGFYLRKGMRHRRVYALRQRLILSGDYDSSEITTGNIFDEELAAAVHRFQQRHGLKVDGIVGPATLAALNIPVERRVRQIELNMERWRWIPHNLGRRYIQVNIANFSLQAIENSKKVLGMRVVVGKPHRSTPVFSDTVEYLIFNPYWYLPTTIIVEDTVPDILKNPDYLAEKKIKVFAAGTNQTQELDPATIDWTAITKKNLPYKLRQEPGSGNVLGRVKFMFPNKYSVYLHDTPSQQLFQKTARDFSSGCIRVEKPVELASYLLGDDPLWTRENILTSMKSGKRQLVNLPEKIPIYILYRTAWVDEEGKLNFRKDIYDRDILLAAALDGIPPQPSKHNK